jgi:L-cysteine desulfidase
MENERVEIEVDKNFIKNKWLITIPATLPVQA